MMIGSFSRKIITMIAKRIFKSAVVFLTITSPPLLASTLQFGIDNDVIFQSDGDYSSGLYLGYGAVHNSNNAHGIFRLDGGEYSWSAQLGQKIWTPSDLNPVTPVAGERPYAGLLYARLGTGVFKTEQAYDLSLMIGIMGPSSGAESLQKNSHRGFGSTVPQGWDYQVENQVVGDLKVEMDHLLVRTKGQGFHHELSGFGRLVAGNFQPEIAVGAGWRWGRGLGDSFNHSMLRPHRQQVLNTGKQTQAYLYSSIELRHRFKDTAVTGKTLKPVPQITPQKMQGSVTVGGVTYFGSTGVSFSVTGYSRSFKEDKSRWHLISALALNWTF